MPDDAIWLELDDIADDNLCGSLERKEWLGEDEPLLSCNCAVAVDSYLSQWRGAGRLPIVREVW